MKKFLFTIWVTTVLGLIDSYAAQQTAIYAPPDSRFLDGNSSFDGSPGYGFQQLFPAGLFSDLPKGGAILKGVVFRSDASIFGQSKWADNVTGVEVGVSTTTKTSSSLSPVFSENVGNDRTLLTQSSDFAFMGNSPSGTGIPSEFSLGFGSNIEGFLYDPAAGNLLLDLRGFGVPFAVDAFTSTENLSVAYSSLDPSFLKGRLLQKGLAVVFGFYPVPEPTSLGLFALGVFCLFIARKRRQRKEAQVIA